MKSLFAEKSSVQSLSELVEAASSSDCSKRQAAPMTFGDSSMAEQRDIATELKTRHHLLVISGEFTTGKSTLTRHLMGLSKVPAGRGGISAWLSDSITVAPFIPKRPTMYRKNGMLVGHIGRKITPEEVARILAEG